MSYNIPKNIPKNGPIAWYLERYGFGIGAGSPGVDEEWTEMLLRPNVEVVPNPDRFVKIEPLVVYQPFPIIPFLFLIFLIIFVLMPAGWIV